jgi:hypothetical protein
LGGSPRHHLLLPFIILAYSAIAASTNVGRNEGGTAVIYQCTIQRATVALVGGNRMVSQPAGECSHDLRFAGVSARYFCPQEMSPIVKVVEATSRLKLCFHCEPPAVVLECEPWLHLSS